MGKILHRELRELETRWDYDDPAFANGIPETFRIDHRLRRLHELGFDGVAITDSLDVVRGHATEWAVAAARAGADLLLFTSGRDAARAIRVLVPLARRGELDEHVRRVLRFRARLR